MTKGLSRTAVLRIEPVSQQWFAKIYKGAIESRALNEECRHGALKLYLHLALAASTGDRRSMTGARLAVKTSQSERNVWRGIAQLEELRLIRRVRQWTEGGGKAVNLYVLVDDVCRCRCGESQFSPQGGQLDPENQQTSIPPDLVPPDPSPPDTGVMTPCDTGVMTPCDTGVMTQEEHGENGDPPLVPPADPPVQAPPPQPPASGGSMADEEQVVFAAAVLEVLDQAEPEADWWGQAAQPTSTAVDRVFTALQQAKQPSRDPLTYQRTRPTYTGNGRKRDLRAALPEAARRKLAGELQAEQQETAGESHEQESFESFMAGYQDLIASGLATEAQLRECWESHSTAAGAVQGQGG